MMFQKVQGFRKLFVFVVSVGALVGGLVIVKDSASAVGVYTPFAAAVVGIGGWFFKANVDAKKLGSPT